MGRRSDPPAARTAESELLWQHLGRAGGIGSRFAVHVGRPGFATEARDLYLALDAGDLDPEERVERLIGFVVDHGVLEADVRAFVGRVAERADAGSTPAPDRARADARRVRLETPRRKG